MLRNKVGIKKMMAAGELGALGNNVGLLHGSEVGCLLGHWACIHMYGHVLEFWCIHSMSYKHTVSYVRYECTQFTSRHHLLYSNLIPQHPVPLASMNPNHSHQYPQHPRASSVASFSPHLKDCPLYSRKLFCFSIFFYRWDMSWCIMAYYYGIG